MNLRALFAVVPVLAILKLAACSDQENPAGANPPPDDPSGEDGGTEGDGGPPPQKASCQITPGANADAGRVLKGTLLLPESAIEGELYLDSRGMIVCADKSCSSSPGYADAAKVACEGAVISPGLINPHDHISFANVPPHKPSSERYEHRHDWRKGVRGHTKIPSGGPKVDNAVELAELRFVMSGVTAIAGAGGANGLARNVDGAIGQMEGLKMTSADSDTFPLKDNDLTTFPTTCAGYAASRRTAASIANLKGYLPHISEGIDESAHNEFLCQSDDQADPTHDLIQRQTAVVHGVAVNPSDVVKYRTDQTILIWSPRSNIDLYGNTAPVVMYENLGVPIALGTDWLPSGSMNMSRELRCADDLNQRYFGKKFTDKQLWQMVTINAAYAIGAQHAIGQLRAGYVGDIAVFDGRGKSSPYRAVIDAGVEDVFLVMRGGKALYGDREIVSQEAAGGGADCEDLEVCGIPKKACVKKDLGEKTLADLQAAAAKVYPLFYCRKDQPKDEPSCVPTRGATASSPTSSTYAGIKEGDKDGDGVPDGEDNCPTVFNPIRPMDNGKQADADNDGIGDACDKCPLDAGESCTPPKSDDMDGDGIPNGTDNCPEDANPDQTDADKDGKGAACDKDAAGASCDDKANPGTALCPTVLTIVQIRNPNEPGHPKPGDARAIVKGVWVTGVKDAGAGSYGFFIQQEGAATYGGMFVATPGQKPTVKVGNKIDVEGDYEELFGLSQLANTKVTVVDQGTTLPFSPVVIDPAVYASTASNDAAGEPWEGMLCQVPGPIQVTVANSDGSSDFDEFGVGAAKLRIDDYLYDPLDNNYPVGQEFPKIVGICGYSFDNRKIWPRSLADLQ